MKYLPGPGVLRRRWITFILIALVCRGLYFAFQLNESGMTYTPGELCVETGDTPLYFDPVENLIANGTYSPDYRMPGVAAPYYLFRQVLDVADSRDAFVILQWLLSGISAYVLALIAVRLSGSDKFGLAVYCAFLLSANTSWFDASLASDSLAVSMLIFHAYFLQEAVDRKKLGPVLLSGFSLMWLIFLRPIAVPLLLPSAFLLYRYWNGGRVLRPVLLFLLPFLVCDTVWTLRNHRVNGEFNFLTNQGFQPTYFTKEIRYHAMSFIQRYGGNYIWWVPGSDMRWYGIWKGGAELDNEGRSAKEPPAYAYVPGYNRDSLLILSDRVRAVEAGGMPTADSLAEVASINATFDRYAELYGEHAPFNDKVLSRVRMIKNVMFQHGAESIIFRPFSALPLWIKIFKALQAVFYIFSYSIGSIAVLVMLWNWRKADPMLAILLPGTVFYMVLIFPVALRMCEWRYMVHSFPFALLLAMYFSMKGLSLLRDRFLPKRAIGPLA